MIRRILIGLCCFFAWTAAAQDRDSLLAQMNRIKLDTEHYLYGLCTIADEPDPNVSRRVARNELTDRITSFLGNAGYQFLKAENVPEDAVSYLVCPLRPDCFRTLAFLSFTQLEEQEKQLTLKREDLSRKEAANKILSGLMKATTLQEIEDLLSNPDLVDVVRFGRTIDNQAQLFLSQSYLVYYVPKTGKVQEIMAPPDPGGTRRNLVTQAISDPLNYTTTPFWIYLETF